MSTTQLLNINDVREVHQQQLELGGTNDTRVNQFVKILGGMDKILNDYLSVHDHCTLTQLQLQDIHTLLASASSEPIEKNMDQSVEIGSDDCQIILKLETVNSHVVSSFGLDSARNILKVLNSWVPTALHVMCMMLCLTLVFFVPQKYPISMILVLCTCMLVWIPFAIIWWMGVNKRALKLILHSFEFWLKLGYALLFAIFSAIYLKIMFDWHVFIAVAMSIKAILIISYVSSFDGVNKSRFIKIFCSFIAAAMFTILSFAYEFYMEDYTLNIKLFDDSSWDYSVSVTDKLSDSARVLAIFLWKQTVITYWRPNRCILIKKTPYIHWDSTKLTKMLATDDYVELNEIV